MNSIRSILASAFVACVSSAPGHATEPPYSDSSINSICQNVYSGDAAGKYDVYESSDLRQFIQTEEIGCIYSGGVGGALLVTGAYDLKIAEEAQEFRNEWKKNNSLGVCQDREKDASVKSDDGARIDPSRAQDDALRGTLNQKVNIPKLRVCQ